MEHRVLQRNTVLILAFGVFLVLHFTSYTARYQLLPFASTYALLVAGLLLVLNPRPGLLLVAIPVVMVDAILHAPVFSNHTALKNFVTLAFCIAFMTATKADRYNGNWLSAAVPALKGLLITLYFFGVFHKINTDFLNPDVSCASALWQQMPAALSWLQARPFLLMGAYGTLIIETLLLAGLLLDRFRRVAIIAGISFHSLLAVSGYAFYSTFSMLTVTLHLAFLKEHEAQSLVRFVQYRIKRANIGRLPLAGILAAWLGVIYLLARTGSYSAAGMVWLCAMLLLVYSLIQSWRVCDDGDASKAQNASGDDGRDDEYRDDEYSTDQQTLSQSAPQTGKAALLVVALFVFNGFTPYLGLKTAQSMNMFANLRLEGGQSNHYIMSTDWQVFGYLKDVVTIDRAAGDPYLNYVTQEGLGLVYYDLLNRLDKNPDARVDFARNGVQYTNASATTLAADIARILHPAWVRKWFHFIPVDLESPKKCALNR